MAGGLVDMECQGVQHLLGRYFEGLLPAKGRRGVADHLATCANCLSKLQDLHRASALANPMVTREPPASLWTKLLAAGLSLDKSTLAQPFDGAHRNDVPAALRADLRGSGPVVFPQGQVARGAWEFGRLNELLARQEDKLIQAIADRAYTKLSAALPRKDIVLVCFSRPMHQCGMRLANKLFATGRRNVHVVMADDYYRPTLYCRPDELRGQFVAVFVDVVHSGNLLDRLCKVCLASAPRRVVALVVIDQNPERIGFTRRYGLWIERREERIGLAAWRASKRESTEPRYFDPDSGRAYASRELPAEIADPERALETIERDLKAVEPLLPYIEETKALQANRSLYGVCYPWVLDLMPLLDHSGAKKNLLGCAKEHLRDLAEAGNSVAIVYPVERHQRAGRWAKEIGKAMGWPVVAVGWRDQRHYRSPTPKQRWRLSRYTRLVIVDAAIRSGKTLQSLVECLRPKSGKARREIHAFYAWNGLFEKQQTELEGRLRVHIRSLFRLPFGPPINAAGKLWRARLKETLASLREFEGMKDAPPWVPLVREFCTRQLKQSGRRRQQGAYKNLLGELRRALEEANDGEHSRLSDIWKDGKRTRVARLDVEAARHDPSLRNVLYGGVANHVCPSLRESAALALAVMDDYSWLTKDWMAVQHKLLTQGSKPWQFLASIGYWIKQKNEPGLIVRVREAVQEFEQSQRRGKLFLEPGLESACGALQALLSEP